MDTAARTEVACNAFLRWLEAIAGRDDVAMILRAMAGHLEKEPAVQTEQPGRGVDAAG
jgi:hypothetical protein